MWIKLHELACRSYLTHKTKFKIQQNVRDNCLRPTRGVHPRPVSRASCSTATWAWSRQTRGSLPCASCPFGRARWLIVCAGVLRWARPWILTKEARQQRTHACTANNPCHALPILAEKEGPLCRYLILMTLILAATYDGVHVNVLVWTSSALRKNWRQLTRCSRHVLTAVTVSWPGSTTNGPLRNRALTPAGRPPLGAHH